MTPVMKQLIAAVAFVDDKHGDQRQKDADGSPYIDHPIALAKELVSEADIDELFLLSSSTTRSWMRRPPTRSLFVISGKR